MKMFTEWNPVKGYIIMEYLENLKAVHLYETVTPQEVKQILRHKAAMEASSLDVPSEERNEYISPFKTIFAAVFNEKMLDQMLTVFSTIRRRESLLRAGSISRKFSRIWWILMGGKYEPRARNGRSFMSRRFMVHERFVETKRRCSQHGCCCGLSDGPFWLVQQPILCGCFVPVSAARIGRLIGKNF
ncbi:hypothetical protein COOONC_24295 [Cooperia oncophora]